MSTTTGAQLHEGRPQPRGALDSFFHITERGSTVGTEVRAGVVTFFAMAYIIVLNPIILSSPKDVSGQSLNFAQVSATTALAAGVMTILFGLVARLPFALAAGLSEEQVATLYQALRTTLEAAVMAAEPRLRPATADGWLPRPDWRPVSKFEARAQVEGREVRDLLYYRT